MATENTASSELKPLQSHSGQGAAFSPDPYANWTSRAAEPSESHEASIEKGSDAPSDPPSGGSKSDRPSGESQGSGLEEAQSSESIVFADSGAHGTTRSGSMGLADDGADGVTARGADRPPGSAVARVRQLLHRRMRIEVADGRVFVGKLHCLDKQGNVILFDAQEYAPQMVFPKHDPPRSPSALKSPRGVMVDEGERFDRILRGEPDDLPLEPAHDGLQTNSNGPLGSPLAPASDQDASLGSSMGGMQEVPLRPATAGAAVPGHGSTGAEGERSAGNRSQPLAAQRPSLVIGDGGAQSLADLLPSPPSAGDPPCQQLSGELPRHAGQEPAQEKSALATVEKPESDRPTLVEQRRLALALIPAKVRVSCQVECDVEEELALLALS